MQYGYFLLLLVINLKRKIVKNYILLLFCAALPLICSAQKITLGSCETKDGGTYQGEMASGKPHGKGKTVYKNGDTYEGEYVKG